MHTTLHKIMSIKEHLDSAEESIRQAIIHCLNNKQDENIKDLFKALQLVKDINSKTLDIDLSGLDFDYSTYLNNDPITFESDYITGVDGTDYIPGKRPGGDMDSLDNVIEFKTKDDESRKD